MKVLHLISSSGFFGAEKVLVELAVGTFKSGRDIEPFVGIIRNSHNPHTEIRDALSEMSIPVGIFECNGKFDIRTICEIRSYVKNNKIDVIHSHGYKSNFFACASALFMNVKRVTTVHNWIRTDPKLKMYAVMDKIALNSFDKIVVVSHELKNEVAEAGINGNKLHLINNGISATVDTPQLYSSLSRKDLGIGQRSKVIGTVGRMSEEKGHIFFVKAWKSVLNKSLNISRCHLSPPHL